MRRDNWLFLVAAGAASFSLSGCAPSAAHKPKDPSSLIQSSVGSVELADEELAPAVMELLAHDREGQARLVKLVSVVRFQMHRAAALFERGEHVAGLRIVEGALLLVRVGELRAKMFEGAEAALIEAAASVARVGDEGRATALYSILQDVLSPQDGRLSQVKSHAVALEQWRAATQDVKLVSGAGAAAVSASDRLLVQPTAANLEKARQCIGSWVELGKENHAKNERPRTMAEGDEYNAARRALRGGASNIAAVFLRNGDAAGGALALESELFSDLPQSERLSATLSQAADGNVEAWAELFRHYVADSRQTGLVDANLANGAAFGAALQLYRGEPSELRAAMPLATLLVEHGLGEVAPLVLKSSLDKEPDPRALSWGLRAVMQALARAEQSGELVVARRTYSNSASLLKLASSAKFLGKVRPAASELSYMMGAMESRAGNLVEARAHLQVAIAANPTRGALRLLAGIERQQQNSAAALNSVRSMFALAGNEGDIIGQARARLVEYDILRATDEAAAQVALESARSLAIAAKKKAAAGAEVAFVESTLAEVHERKGDLVEATRATERALEAARNNLSQMAASLQDASRRALTTGTLDAGRSILRHAIDASLDDEALVYIALWTQLLEQRVEAVPDGLVREALVSIERSDSWVGVLREWGRGALSASELRAKAKTLVQRVEAEFYVTLAEHTKTPSQTTWERLRALANSEAIELVEVRIARDISAARQLKPSVAR